MEKPKIDLWGILLLVAFFICLSIGGYLSFKSIKYDILTQLEKVPLILPTPIPLNSATPSATTTQSAQTK